MSPVLITADTRCWRSAICTGRRGGGGGSGREATMRGLMDHRRGLLATATGIAAGLAGGLLIAGCGPLADPGSPSNPAEAANAPPSVSNSDRPDQAGPSSSPSGPDPAPV